MKWKDIKVRNKIIMCFAVPMLLMGVMMIWTFVSTNRAADEANAIKDAHVPILEEGSRMEVNVIQIQQWLTDISATRGLDGLNDGFSRAEENYKSFLARLERVEALYKKLNDSKGLELTAKLRGDIDRFYEGGKKMADAYVKDGTAEGNKMMKEFDTVSENIQVDMKALTASQHEETGNEIGNVISNMKTLRSGVIVLFTVMLALITLTGMFLTRTITMSLSKSIDVLHAMSEGDLTRQVELNQKDEFGYMADSLNAMLAKIKEILGNVKTASDSVASGSQELSSSSEQMSRGVSEQSGRSSQIATASTEMSQTIIDIAKNAANIASAVSDTTKTANDGREIVQKSVGEVQAIAVTVGESSSLVASLGKRSQQIGDIVRVIKDIADQTNLLALNAAIEAARAGDHGSGFAVVADEVRKLAERTAKATSEIGHMIGTIQDEVGRSVASMDDATKKVEVGVEYSAKTGEAFNAIVQSVEGLQSMVHQIASATEEMSTTSETISSDIETIARVSHETSSSSEQIAASANDLARLSTELRRIAGQFKV
ncbi:MAG: methyl-accepting chemotaxis protein [Nitrospirae bacterium]|nr:methyl-accepting chemotaxis protein [Nitrospirota bacterium]